MAVVLYKNGERVLIKPQALQSHLGNGYFLTIEESIIELESTGEKTDEIVDVKVEQNQEVIESSTDHEKTDENIDKDDEEISDEDVRLLAKELGISHWHVTSIDKLKVKIEEAQNGDST